MTFARGRARPLLLVLASVALVAACSSPAASPSASGGGIAVTGAWIRNSTAMTGAMAGYLVITNTGSTADTLVSVSSPIAKTVQMHKTVPVTPAPSQGGMGSAMPSTSSGMGGMGSAMPAASGTSPMMTMVQVDSVDIPASSTVEFKPGGFHIMFMDLNGTPTAGQTVDLTLVFAKAGSITVKADVKAQ